MALASCETNITGREVIARLGDTEHFHTSLHLFLAEKVGLYASFNSAGREGAAHVVRTQLFQEFADRYFPSAVTDRRGDAQTAAEHARLMTGRWQASRQPQSNFLDILNLFGQVSVGADGEGRLGVPSLKDSGGAVQRWVEISPFVWRDENGHDRLAAKVVDGKPVRWSFDLVAPFTVYDRVPASRSAALLPAALVLRLGARLRSLFLSARHCC